MVSSWRSSQRRCLLERTSRDSLIRKTWTRRWLTSWMCWIAFQVVAHFFVVKVMDTDLGTLLLTAAMKCLTMPLRLSSPRKQWALSLSLKWRQKELTHSLARLFLSVRLSSMTACLIGRLLLRSESHTERCASTSWSMFLESIGEESFQEQVTLIW